LISITPKAVEMKVLELKKAENQTVEANIELVRMNAEIASVTMWLSEAEVRATETGKSAALAQATLVGLDVA
jgi:hypothetical protein